MTSLVLRFVPVLFLVLCCSLEPALAQNDLGSGYVPPQAIDGTRSNKKSTQATNQQSAGGLSGKAQSGSAANPRNQFETLFRELDNLIPGSVADDPTRKAAVEDAITAFQLKDGGKVVEIFNEQRKLDPDFPPTELLLAGLSYAVNDSKTGRVLLERSAMQNPESPSTYSAFARLAINEGRMTDAIALLEKTDRILKASSLKPKSKEFYSRLYLDAMIDLAMRQERFDDARGFLEKQQAALPGNAKVLMVSAELEFKQDNVDKALEYLAKLRQVQPSTRMPETIIAMWFNRVGKKPEAEKWVKLAAGKYPTNSGVQLEYANWALNQGELPIASEAIKRAEATGGETVLSKNLKARIAFSRESYGVAEAHYKTLMDRQKGNFDSSNMYALCLIESTDESKQQRAKEIAVQNFRSLPNNLVAQATMGYIHLRNGELEQSKTVLARAAQARGSSPEIDFFLGALLKEMNQVAEARKTLEGALKYEGFFLYRSAAQKLLTSMGGSELPAPKK